LGRLNSSSWLSSNRILNHFTRIQGCGSIHSLLSLFSSALLPATSFS
jgi:hypothetical protein